MIHIYYCAEKMNHHERFLSVIAPISTSIFFTSNFDEKFLVIVSDCERDGLFYEIHDFPFWQRKKKKSVMKTLPIKSGEKNYPAKGSSIFYEGGDRNVMWFLSIFLFYWIIFQKTQIFLNSMRNSELRNGETT